MRVLVIGEHAIGKIFRPGLVAAALNRTHRHRPVTHLIICERTDVTRDAIAWACERSIRVTEYPLTPDEVACFGESAGGRRDRRVMWEAQPEGCIAFPGEYNTASMRRCAEGAVKVWDVLPPTRHDATKLPKIRYSKPEQKEIHELGT